MGFHRHNFDISNGKKPLNRDADSACDVDSGLDTHLFKVRNPGELIIGKRIKEACPSRYEPEALLLDAVIERHRWQFNAAHINAALDGLAMSLPANSVRNREVYENRQAVALKLMEPLLIHLDTLKIWECACILRSLGALKIKDDFLGPKLLERFANQCQFAAPLDFCQAIEGVVDLGLNRPREISLLSKITTQLFRNISGCKLGQLAAVINSMASHFCSDIRILDYYCEHTILEPEVLSLALCGHLATDFSRIGYYNDEFFKVLSQKVCTHILSKSEEALNPQELWGVVSFARGLDTLGYSVDPILIATLSRFVAAPPLELRDYQLGVLLSEAYPVLISRGIEFSDASLAQLSRSRFDDQDKSLANVTHFERDVGRCLERLHYSFEASVDFHSFSLDYLITLPSGVRVNLEADGDRYHLVKRLDNPSLPAQYSARNKYRDDFLNLQEIRVVRVLGSEWSAKTLTERCQLLENRISAMDC